MDYMPGQCVWRGEDSLYNPAQATRCWSRHTEISAHCMSSDSSPLILAFLGAGVEGWASSEWNLASDPQTALCSWVAAGNIVICG